MGFDFYTIREREGSRKGTLEVYFDFKVIRSKDLMLRGGAFYAIWDEARSIWSTDEYDVPRLLDEDMRAHTVTTPVPEGLTNWKVSYKFLSNYSSASWPQFRMYLKNMSDSSTQLDENLIFNDQDVKKSDYVSRKLPYPLQSGDISAWDELISVLYDPEERAKIEWAIGAIVSGDSKTIQKFLVFYGPGGTGKSTVLGIIEKLFVGYIARFDAKALTSGTNAFATDVLRTNPLVLIQHDGDMSKIADNTVFNSIVSHEIMTLNEKFKSSYESRSNAFPFLGTNKPVKITDAKSGIIRRLIDVIPTGEKLAPRKYQTLMAKIDFELGAIAAHCLEVYRNMGKEYYESYRATEMMLQTDVFFNFIEAEYDIFSTQEGVTLKQAFELYKAFIAETGVEYALAQYKFREELRNYFDNFEDRVELPDGTRVRSWYSGFKGDRFKSQVTRQEMAFSLVMDEDVSLFDEMMKDEPAQYAKADGTPRKYWTDKPKQGKDGEMFVPSIDMIVSTRLLDLDTHKEHYVKVPLNHIVIDFDLEDEYGAKSLEKNLEAASQWPSTYAEISKSGNGVHLHYIWAGDVSELSRVFEPGIEIKVYTGDTSLRRKLTKCNNIPVATLSSGLPIKEKKVIDVEGVKSEQKLRDLIMRNLRKEIHPGTKSSVDFINKILNDAYNSDLSYDVTDMRQKILNFAMGSTNQQLAAVKQVQTMQFKSKDVPDEEPQAPEDLPILAKSEIDTEPSFFDVEVFPNLFVLCWKGKGSKSVVRMINPTPQQIEDVLKMKLIGFNNRRYDNHILYGALMGYNNEQLYQLSQKIINKSKNAFFGAAFNLSYTDIFDFASAGNKKSLKVWEIELGLKHDELGLPWDQPVPEELWERVADYCANDVIATEEVFDYLEGDWTARQILAALSGLSVNDTTNAHSIRIMFGNERNPQSEFNYTDLSKQFEGYTFDKGKSTYKGELVGEGGLVRGKPGMYTNVAVLDVASMHPTTIEQLNLFGGYTKKFSEIKNARVMIKRGEYDSARYVLDGKLAPFLVNENNAKGLSDALKTVINSVYGLTSASFDNAFRDPRNIDNIVAKRGALFMIDLMHFVESKGFEAIHIKTDSIKIPDATKEIIEAVMEFGQRYGYEFEHEATYEKMVLVNQAVYVAYVAAGKKPAHWEAVGAQFQQPYVFKTLFSKEKPEFKDMCVTKSVTTALYLDFTNDDVDQPLALVPDRDIRFIGKTGLFCPIKKGKGGAQLMREKDGKFYSATGAKDWYWLEADMVKALEKEEDIDLDYFRVLVDEAKDDISQYGDFEWFIS